MIYTSIERRKIASERHLPASSGLLRHIPSHVETIFTNLVESKQDSKSKGAAATQGEIDQPRNPATPASSIQSVK
jgi:hypothetical protein